MDERTSAFYLSRRTRQLPAAAISPKPTKADEPGKPRDRHGAITEFDTLGDYKRWVQTTRNTWNAENKE